MLDREDGQGRTGNAALSRISGSVLAPGWRGGGEKGAHEGSIGRCQENLISGAVGGVCHFMD